MAPQKSSTLLYKYDFTLYSKRPGKLQRKMGAQMSPLSERALVPCQRAAWKNHLDVLSGAPPTELNTRSRSQMAGALVTFPPWLVSPQMLAVLAAPGSLPVYLNLCLSSQPNSNATSSWKPTETTRPAPFSSLARVSHGPRSPIPARLLDQSPLNTRERYLGSVT